MKVLSNYKMLMSAAAIGFLTSCAALKNKSDIQQAAVEQAQRDFLFYKNIFYQTQAAKDSSAVADFNKTVASMGNITKTKRTALSKEILKNAEENGINKEEKNIIKGVRYVSNPLSIQLQQMYADRFVFEKFFEKYGASDKLK